MTQPDQAVAPERSDLRTRKRAAAMERIQGVALDLFDQHGYDRVSVADIASAAEVGERSIYRYFGSKPMLVLYDATDRQSMELLAVRVRDEPILEAVASVLDDIGPLLTGDIMDEFRRRFRHVDQHRDLRAALAEYVENLGDSLGAAIATARDLPVDDLTARVHGRCIVAALSVAIDRWRETGDDGGLIGYFRDALTAIADLGESVEVVDG